MHNISKTKLRKYIYRYISTHNRTHYLKWAIDDSWYIRFFFPTTLKHNLRSKWFLKNHFTKEHFELTTAEALDYINHRALTVEPLEIFSTMTLTGFRRCIINHNMSTFKTFEEPLKK